MHKHNHSRLQQQVQRQIKRMQNAAHEPLAWLSSSVYIGTLGLVFVLPLVAGAYLGQWLDSLLGGYSIRWTLSLIFTGIVIGIMNVYLLLRK